MTYDEDGLGYGWDGKIVGAGKMRLLREIAATDANPSARLECELTFLRPWKSVAAVGFEFVESDGVTAVNWTMEGTLPFFLFWMKGMMEVMVGMDYNRGLLMLKDLVESGSVPSSLRVEEKAAQPACDYVGIRCASTLETIGPAMKDALAKLCAAMESAGIEAAGACFASYDRFKVKQGTAHFGYLVGFPVVSVPTNLPGGLVSGHMPACSAYVVEHTGPYRHLGNAWAVGMMHGRAKCFRQAKAKFRPPFERYDNDPAKVPEAELKTSVCFPMR